MLIPQPYGEIQAWTVSTSTWLQSRLAQINRDTAAANTIELVDATESDIRQFIRELEQKKREVNQKNPRDTKRLQYTPAAQGKPVGTWRRNSGCHQRRKTIHYRATEKMGRGPGRAHNRNEPRVGRHGEANSNANRWA